MRRGVDVGGMFFVETTVCDGSGEVSSIDSKKTGYFYKISVENGTTIKKDIDLKSNLPNGQKYLEFRPVGSPPGSLWRATCLAVLTTADDQCQIDPLQKGEDRIQCEELSYKDTGITTPNTILNVNLELRIKVQ